MRCPFTPRYWAARRWARLAHLRGTRSGNARWGTRVQGLSWAACGVAQTLLPVSNVWKASPRS